MKKVKILTLVTVSALLVTSGVSVFGQVRTTAHSKRILRVGKRLNTLGVRFLVETPQYDSSESRGSADPKKWQMLAVQYETYPEWIDELSIQFYALGVTRDERTGKKAFSLYKQTVKYADIAQGRSHKASVFIRPTAIKRYGEIFAVAMVFSVDGKVVEEVSQELQKMPKQWWKNQAVIGRPDITVRTGYMLNRAQSPWSLINIDDFEVIK